MVTSTSVAASGGSLHLGNGKATGNMVCYHRHMKTRMDIRTNTSADILDDVTSGTFHDIPEDAPANASADAHGDAPTPEPPRARRRWPRRIAIAFAALAVLTFVGAAAFVVYASDYYRAGDAARAASASATTAPVEQGPNYLAFGDPAASTGIVFYPGAKVEYTAYAPLMRDLAERGHFAGVVEMPFNFAFFDIDAADGSRAAYPQVKYWWVGGHSLGGSMAAQYAANHADDPSLAGLVLLGAYSASDLSASDLEAIVVYGENDRVLDCGKLRENASLLPPNSLMVEIPGGNHAGFGDYGPQEGDGPAAIAPREQQEQTADAVDAVVVEAA